MSLGPKDSFVAFSHMESKKDACRRHRLPPALETVTDEVEHDFDTNFIGSVSLHILSSFLSSDKSSLRSF